MNRVLCSTGALIGRPNGRNLKLLFEYAGQLSCDGFEFMMYDSWYEKEKEIVADLKTAGVRTPVMHCEKRIGQKLGTGEPGAFEEAVRLFRINCRIAAETGAETMVLHLWDGEVSDRHFPNNLRAYPELACAAAEYGVLLTVENVVCNRGDPMSHLAELAKVYPDIAFTLDTKMAAFHGQLALVYEDAWRWLWDGGHIRHLHINDYRGGYMDWDRLRTLPVGDGQIDFQRFFDFVKETEYAGDYTVEATAFGPDGRVDTAMLNRCFETVRRLAGQ